MNAFIDVLEKEKQNHELLSLALDCLTILLSSADETTDDDELGERFAEVLCNSFFINLSILDDATEKNIRSSTIGIS